MFTVAACWRLAAFGVGGSNIVIRWNSKINLAIAVTNALVHITHTHTHSHTLSLYLSLTHAHMHTKAHKLIHKHTNINFYKQTTIEKKVQQQFRIVPKSCYLTIEVLYQLKLSWMLWLCCGNRNFLVCRVTKLDSRIGKNEFVSVCVCMYVHMWACVCAFEWVWVCAWVCVGVCATILIVMRRIDTQASARWW